MVYGSIAIRYQVFSLSQNWPEPALEQCSSFLCRQCQALWWFTASVRTSEVGPRLIPWNERIFYSWWSLTWILTKESWLGRGRQIQNSKRKGWVGKKRIKSQTKQIKQKQKQSSKIIWPALTSVHWVLRCPDFNIHACLGILVHINPLFNGFTQL